MKIKRTCEQCGKEFKTIPSKIKHGGGKFCSCKCQSESRKKSKIKRICKQCNNEFEIYPYQLKQGGGAYCSRKCHYESQKKRIKRICEQCGKEFEAYPSLIKQGYGIFCSRKCRGEYQRGKNNSCWKIKEPCICVTCKCKFYVKPSRLERNSVKFCSKECYSKWQSIHQRGENHPGWQGGISFEPYCYKFNEEFKEYIRAKFGRVCFLCSKTEEENNQRLSVHHVNYNKNCGCDEDETCQFVPLCRSCNAKVNSNRSEWEAKIKAMMKNKLNGWYI